MPTTIISDTVGVLLVGAMALAAAWVAFVVLRAIWTAFSAPAVARKAGEVVGSLANAYREGRGK